MTSFSVAKYQCTYKVMSFNKHVLKANEKLPVKAAFFPHVKDEFSPQPEVLTINYN